MLRLHADENVLWLAVAQLRARGHDVVWVAETSPSTLDPEVLREALERFHSFRSE